MRTVTIPELVGRQQTLNEKLSKALEILLNASFSLVTEDPRTPTEALKENIQDPRLLEQLFDEQNKAFDLAGTIETVALFIDSLTNENVKDKPQEKTVVPLRMGG